MNYMNAQVLGLIVHVWTQLQLLIVLHDVSSAIPKATTCLA